MSNVHKVVVLTGSYEGWVDLIKKNRYSPEKADIEKLIVDFTYARFVEPFHLVSLACLIEEYYLLCGAQIEFTGGTFTIRKYLDNIRFYDYWTEGFDRNAFTDTKIDTALCLWKVTRPMINSYAYQAQQYFQNLFFEGKNLESLNISLAEVFNNIYDHSNSYVDGYVITQYYPRKDEIITAVCDFGVGIPNKINNIWLDCNKPKLDDPDALRAAFIRNMSSKSTPRNRGFGLPNLMDNVSHLKGQFLIYSNQAIPTHQNANGLLTYKSSKYLQGTLINLKLNTVHLPEIEESVDNDEFIF